MRIIRTVAAMAALAAAAGCRTKPTQRYAIDFVDEEGRVATVEFVYGDGSMHSAPYIDMRGEKAEYRSDKRCRVKLPGGGSFTGYQTLSEIGTKYVSSDEEWACLSMGLFCVIAHRMPDGAYALHFSGQAVEGERDAPRRGERHTEWNGYGGAPSVKTYHSRSSRAPSGGGAGAPAASGAGR